MKTESFVWIDYRVTHFKCLDVNNVSLAKVGVINYLFLVSVNKNFRSYFE